MEKTLIPIKSPDEIILGMRVKDLLTGVEGIAWYKIVKYGNWIQFGIQPQGGETDRKEDIVADWQTIAIIDDGLKEYCTKAEPFRINMGDTIYDPVLKLKGTVISNITYFNGCKFIDYMPPANKDFQHEGKLVPEERVVLKKKAKPPTTEETPKKAKGGPSIKPSRMA